MRKINIDEATEQQLRAFSRDTLGLSLPPNCRIETIRAKIITAWDKPYITLADEGEEQPQVGSPPPAPEGVDEKPAEGRVRIIIAITEEPGGDEAVPVGVNGKVMLIPRGREVDIPERYFEALKNAVTFRYDPMPDNKGLNPVPRQIPAYPFQVISRLAA